jgi:hypothetical protein
VSRCSASTAELARGGAQFPTPGSGSAAPRGEPLKLFAPHRSVVPRKVEVTAFLEHFRLRQAKCFKGRGEPMKLSRRGLTLDPAYDGNFSDCLTLG